MMILVTGALGHIGSRLIRYLPERFPDAELLLVDNLAAQRYCSLFDLPREARFRFVEGDVLRDDPRAWIEGADAVVHLAALTDAASSFDRAAEVEEVNLRGAERVAEACARLDVPLVFLSTTSVYGPQGDLVAEDSPESVLNPQSPYAESKLRAERRLAELGKTAGLRFVIARFGTIFGPSPGMRFHTAVNKFCWLATLGRPLTVWRTAYDQRRPYLHLEDGVRAIAFFLEKGLFDNDVYNVVTANLTVREVIDHIRAVIPDVTVEYVDNAIMNQHSYAVSADKIARKGFVAKGDPDEGIRRTLALLSGLRAMPILTHPAP